MPKHFCCIVLFCVLGCALWAWAGTDEFEVIGIQGHVERASGPPELLTLERRDEVTPRVLLAFDTLPQKYVSLALALRGSGIDLLRADDRQLDALIGQAEAGELDADPEELRGLRDLLANRRYLSWEPVLEGHRLVLGELLRAGDEASVSLRTASGVESTISPNRMVRLDPENPALVWTSKNRAQAEKSAAQIQDRPHTPEQHIEPGKDMSPRAAQLFAVWTEVMNAPDCPLRLQGPIAVNETSEEIHLALPLKSYVLDAGGQGDSAQSVMHIRYSLGSDEKMPFTLHLPRLIWLFDKKEEPIGLLRMAKQDTTGTWADAIQRPVQLNVLLQNVELLFGVRSIQDEPVEQIDIQQVVWQTDMAQGKKGLWSGDGQFQARNVRIREFGQLVMDIGSLSGSMQVQDHDLKAFSDLVPEEGDHTLAQDREAVEHLVSTMLAASGTGQFSLTLNDLEAGAEIDPESLHIGLVTIKGAMRASNEATTNRDLNTTYEVSDLRLKTEYSDLALGSFSFALGLSGLDLEKIVQLAHWDQIEEENPLNLFQDVLSGMEVSFSVTEVSGNHDWLDISSLGSLSAGLSLSGVSSSAQDIGLRYNHSGLQDVQDVPAEFTPESAELDVHLVQVPMQELFFMGLLGGMEARSQALGLLSGHGTRLDVKQLELALPGGGIKAKALALAQGSAGAESGEQSVLEMKTDLEIRGLDHMVQALTSHMDDQKEIEQLQAIAAFINLAAEEKMTEKKTPVLFLKIIANSQGHISANGKDLTPLFSNPAIKGQEKAQ